jgi:cation transport regulator ChaC
LVWRPGFAYAERRVGVVCGFARRFWQGSLDHRGVPGSPGRVVTLVEEPGTRCHGVVYRLHPEGADVILRALDHREKGGYIRARVAVELGDASVVQALTWIGDPGCSEYLGPAEEHVIAQQVRGSVGPSGRNDDYVLQLAAALREMGAVDEHVFGIERLVRAPQGC